MQMQLFKANPTQKRDHSLLQIHLIGEELLCEKLELPFAMLCSAVRLSSASEQHSMPELRSLCYSANVAVEMNYHNFQLTQCRYTYVQG